MSDGVIHLPGHLVVRVADVLLAQYDPNYDATHVHTMQGPSTHVRGNHLEAIHAHLAGRAPPGAESAESDSEPEPIRSRPKRGGRKRKEAASESEEVDVTSGPRTRRRVAIAAGRPESPDPELKPRGRPRKTPSPEAGEAPRKPRGRPRKVRPASPQPSEEASAHAHHPAMQGPWAGSITTEDEVSSAAQAMNDPLRVKIAISYDNYPKRWFAMRRNVPLGKLFDRYEYDLQKRRIGLDYMWSGRPLNRNTTPDECEMQRVVEIVAKHNALGASTEVLPPELFGGCD